MDNRVLGVEDGAGAGEEMVAADAAEEVVGAGAAGVAGIAVVGEVGQAGAEIWAWRLEGDVGRGVMSVSSIDGVGMLQRSDIRRTELTCLLRH